MRRLIAWTVVALVFASSSSATAAPTPNPCKVLKKTEIQRVFGGRVAAPSRNGGLCVWDINGGLGHKNGGSLSAELDEGSGAADNYEGFAPAGEPVSGVGDKAFYGPSASSGFNVLKGDAYLRLSTSFNILGSSPSEAALRKKLTKLAKIAVKRI